jgi:peptide/nickel transport system permease protein
MGISTALVGISLLGFYWTPFDPEAVAIGSRLLPPTATHLLGTDHFGRDILSMIMSGGLITLGVAFSAVMIGIVIGTPVGIMAAARYQGRLDDAVMRTNDLIFAFPALVTAVLITARFGPGMINAVIAIGIFNIPVFARISRAAALPIWQRDFILVARLAGKSATKIGAGHVLGNILPILLVQATIQFSLAILAEAGLSYIGLGVQPPQASWGRMLADSQTLVELAPHTVLVPGMTILLAVLGFNLMGEGLGKQIARPHSGEHA